MVRPTAIDDSARLLGPFWRPLAKDWAFWLFCVVVAVDFSIRVAGMTADGSVGNVVALVAFGVPAELVAWLVVFAIGIGIPRGFLLGARGGRRVRRAPPAGDHMPI